jgi:hypothetical protein
MSGLAARDASYCGRSTAAAQMIDLGLAPRQLHAAWELALDLYQQQPDGWVLIGAQMVALHGMEHGRRPPRTSEDIDLLVDVKVLARGTERVSKLLLDMGLELDGASPMNVGHRFVGRGARVDVLAPDGLGERARLMTVPPAHTVMVPGGRKALNRAEVVEVRLGQRVGHVPRPDLLGAIVVKAEAVGVDDAKENQRQDLAFLLGLIDDPRMMAARLDNRERAILSARTDLLDPAAPAWRVIDNAEDAHLALRILTAH